MLLSVFEKNETKCQKCSSHLEIVRKVIGTYSDMFPGILNSFQMFSENVRVILQKRQTPAKCPTWPEIACSVIGIHFDTFFGDFQKVFKCC